ncbi:MAG: glycine oxidase ThiO [Pseudomonadota bacterium]
MDALIIGAGINGLLTALALAGRGLNVTVVDRGAVARESTWAGAGILSPLLPWDYGEEINALTERGRALWPELAERLRRDTAVDPEYWQCGMLVEGSFDRDAAFAWCRQHGWDYSATAPDTGKAPRSGLWLPQVAQARNPRLAKSIETACRQAGIRILDHLGISGLRHGNGVVEAALGPNGEFHADRYVIASGAWSGRLLGDAALGLRISPVRGQILLFKAAPGTLNHIVFRHGKYLVPRRDGHILAGSTLEDAGFDKTCTGDAKAALLEFALDTLPALRDAELVHQWSGLRPGSPGNLPTIARHPELTNLYINSGHFRYGVTMAPASAELLTQLLLASPTTLDPTPYVWPGA